MRRLVHPRHLYGVSVRKHEESSNHSGTLRRDRLTRSPSITRMIPPTAAYTWRNLPLDVGHVLAYFVAHEGHHRGQIVLLARQLGHRLPADLRNGLWQWTKRAAEARH
jgi:uncharacterized damage-inducible protein DinB